jgi:uncharacterized glyoxalase superfamily metalloenzyme YdcJ
LARYLPFLIARKEEEATHTKNDRKKLVERQLENQVPCRVTTFRVHESQIVFKKKKKSY